MALSRALALFIGGFSLLNIVGELRYRGFDANLWWIDFRPNPPLLSRTFLGVSSIFLIAYAVRPILSSWRRASTIVVVWILLCVTLWNALYFYYLLAIEKITAGFPIAFSLFVATALALTIVPVLRSKNKDCPKMTSASPAVMIITVMVCLLAFPLAQMYCFGLTDYSRTADAIVVFGARVYADGRVSDALADRVRTGCRLYLDGSAPKIIMSGGPGDGDIHETDAMKMMAIEFAVPAEAILQDSNGVNTQATVKNTCEMFDLLGIQRVLVVSHFYHLPRIKMTYQRQQCEVYTVPAKESYTLTAMPMYILREVAALWVYYLRPIVP